MRPEIGHTIDPVKDVLGFGFPSKSNTLFKCVCATHMYALLPFSLLTPFHPRISFLRGPLSPLDSFFRPFARNS